jgi:hypothetical protein
MKVIIKRLIIIGNLGLIIKLIKSLLSSDGKLIRTIKRIRMETTKFESVEYFHILKALNQRVDHLANKVVLLGYGSLRKKVGIQSSSSFKY